MDEVDVPETTLLNTVDRSVGHSPQILSPAEAAEDDENAATSSCTCFDTSQLEDVEMDGKKSLTEDVPAEVVQQQQQQQVPDQEQALSADPAEEAEVRKLLFAPFLEFFLFIFVSRSGKKFGHEVIVMIIAARSNSTTPNQKMLTTGGKSKLCRRNRYRH